MYATALRRIIFRKFPYGNFKYVGGDINAVKEFFMNKKLIFSVLLVCLLAVVAVVAFAQNSPKPGSERWEYTILEVDYPLGGARDNNQFIQDTNRLGAQGWELVSTGSRIHIFKRKL
jgi:uncharacterized membrane protein